MSQDYLLIIPQQITFTEVDPKQVQESYILVKNITNQTQDLTFKLYNKKKFDIKPEQFIINPQQEQLVNIKGKLNDEYFLQELNDQIYLQGDDFEQRIQIKFVLNQKQKFQTIEEEDESFMKESQFYKENNDDQIIQQYSYISENENLYVDSSFKIQANTVDSSLRNSTNNDNSYKHSIYHLKTKSQYQEVEDNSQKNSIYHIKSKNQYQEVEVIEEEHEVDIYKSQIKRLQNELTAKEQIESNYMKISNLLEDSDINLQKIVDLAVKSEQMECEQKIHQIVKDKDEIIKDQKNQIKQLQEQLQNQSNNQSNYLDNSKLQKEIQQKQKQFLQVSHEFNNLKKENERLINELKIYERQSFACQEIQQNRFDNQDVHELFQEKDQIIKGLQEQVSKQKQNYEFTRKNAQIQIVQEQMQDLQAKLLDEEDKNYQNSLKYQQNEQKYINTIYELQSQIQAMSTKYESHSKRFENSQFSNDQQSEDRNKELEIALKKEKYNYVNLHKKFEEICRKYEKSESNRIQIQDEIDILSQRLTEKDYIEEEEQQKVIAILNGKVSNLKIREQKMMEENAHMEKMYNKVQEELRSIQENSNDMYGSKDSLQILKQENNKLELLFIESTNAEKIQKRKYEVLEREKREISQEYENLNIHVDDVKQNFQRNYDKLLQEKNNLQKQINDLQEEINQLKDFKELTHSQNKLSESKEKIISKLEKENTNLKMNFQHDLNNQRHENDKFKQIGDDQKCQIENLIQNLKNISVRLDEKEQQIEIYRRDSYSVENRVGELLAENSNLNEINGKNLVQIENLKNTVIELKDRAYQEHSQRNCLEAQFQEQLDSQENQLNYIQQSYLQLKNDNEMYFFNIQIYFSIQDSNNQLKKENENLQIQLNNHQQLKQNEQQIFDQKESILKQQLINLKEKVEKLKYQQGDSQNQTRKQSLSEKKSRKQSTHSCVSQAQRSHISKEITQQSESNLSESESQTNRKVRNSNEKLLSLEIQSFQIQRNQDELNIKKLLNKVIQSETESLQYQREQQQFQQQIRELEMEIEMLKKENNILNTQTKHMESTDAQMLNQLNDYRQSFAQVQMMYNRLYKQLKVQQDRKENINGITGDLLDFIDKLDEDKKESLLQLNHEIQEKNDEIQQLNKKIQEMNLHICNLDTQNDHLKMQLKSQNDHIEILSKERMELEYNLRNMQEGQSNIKQDVKNMEKQQCQEVNAIKLKLEESKQEKQNHELAIKLMNEEMLEQNRKYMEAIELYESHIQLIKEKCQQEFVEISNKIYQFNNKNKQTQKKLQVEKENQQNLQKLFENYFENVQIISHKESFSKQSQEKIKILSQEIQKLQNQFNQKNEDCKKLQEELQNCMKGMSSYKVQKIQKKDKLFQDLLEKQPEQNKIKDIAVLEAQLLTSKTQIKLFTEEINYSKDLIQNNQETIKFLRHKEEEQQQQYKCIYKELVVKDQQLLEYQRQLTEDKENSRSYNQIKMETSANQIQQVESDKLNEFMIQLKEKDTQIRELNNDLNRKKEIIQNLKHTKEEKEFSSTNFKNENESLKDESEKQKKQIKELQRQLTNLKDIKDAYEKIKITEKNLQEEKKSLIEKNKTLNTDIQRKQLLIEQYKDKLENNQPLLNQSINLGISQEEAEKQIKKLKSDIERKDQNLNNYKNKLEESQQEIDSLKKENLNKTTLTINEVDKEQKKLDQTKMLYQKLQSQYNMLTFLLKRIYRECLVACTKLKNKLPTNQAKKNQNDTSKFTDSMSILNLAPEDIEQFLNPGKFVQNQQKSDPTDLNQMIDKFENLLEESQNLNVTNLYNMVNQVFEERIQLEIKQN